jgi:hypothetical protein
MEDKQANTTSNDINYCVLKFNGLGYLKADVFVIDEPTWKKVSTMQFKRKSIKFPGFPLITIDELLANIDLLFIHKFEPDDSSMQSPARELLFLYVNNQRSGLEENYY